MGTPLPIPYRERPSPPHASLGIFLPVAYGETSWPAPLSHWDPPEIPRTPHPRLPGRSPWRQQEGTEAGRGPRSREGRPLPAPPLPPHGRSPGSTGTGSTGARAGRPGEPGAGRPRRRRAPGSRLRAPQSCSALGALPC